MPTDVLPAPVGRRPVDEASRHDLWERAAHKGLRPGEPVETHLLTLLRGEGPGAARETVSFNAAVAALAAGAERSLPEAFHAAEDVLRDGAAVRLVERLRARRGTGTARQVAGVRA